jgi:moderate conductance mechanosensitive channel
MDAFTELTAEAVATWFAGAPLRILTIIVAAFLVLKLGGRGVDRVIFRLSTTGKYRDSASLEVTAARRRERAVTTGGVLRSTLNLTIVIVASAMLLAELGLNLAPFLASAGILGVAVGLGSQSLFRDVVSGIFLLIEDQYGVGDTITIGDITGTVESVGLRVTTVRASSGVLWYLRNGDILKVGNASQP